MVDRPTLDLPAEDERLARLLIGFAEGDLNEAEMAEWDAALAGSEALQELLIATCLQRQLLPQVLADVSDSTPSVVPAVPPASPVLGFLGNVTHGAMGYFSEGWPLAYLLSTIVFVVGLGIFSLMTVRHHTQIAEQPSASSPKPDDSAFVLVGCITGMADVHWADVNTSTELGNRVSLGRNFKLSSGLMEITYDSGAKVILQGPVTYEVDSCDSGYLSLGKLTARLEKKQSAISGQQSWPAASMANQKSEIRNQKSLAPSPFVVTTPTATVTDLGTEFGVEVDRQGNTVSHVFQGVVKLQRVSVDGKAKCDAVLLRENQSARIEATESKVTAVHRMVDDKAFVREEQFLKMTEDLKLSRLRRWQAYCRQLRNDPALVAHYTCESAGKNNQFLPNVSLAGSLLDGKVEGAEWVCGRLPGKFALYFHGIQSGDRVELPEPYRFNFAGAFSVAVWFKVNRFVTPHQPLITKGEWGWRLQRYCDTNTLVFVRNWEDPDVGSYVFVPGRTNVADSKWHLAVGVYDDTQGIVTNHQLYIDGVLDGELSSPSRPLRYNNHPVWLGNLDEKPDREFPGLIDEAAIFARALSLREIADMFQAGKPSKE